MTKSKLILSNGMSFEGDSIGEDKDISGELVFTTGMVGYPQSFTDPSYHGQTLVFSFPLIGNYGLPHIDLMTDGSHLKNEGMESFKSWINGVVLSSPSSNFSHYNYKHKLDEWLKMNSISGICNVDTRELIHQIRDNSGLLGRIVKSGSTENSEFFNPHNKNLVKEVSTKSSMSFGSGSKKVCVIDFGVKGAIINKLVKLGCTVNVIPWNSTDIPKADAYLLSNGPGNPNLANESIPLIKNILELKKPTLGICLGHQLLALAIGANVERLQHGHRGYNHPVIDTFSKRGYITSQNHGYHVKEDTLSKDWQVSFRNVNDGSVEGIKHTHLPFEGVQFHPEASGGPNDCQWILEDFVERIS
ncbi:MAG: glutamine-hydrolyzing carbamoyl-phosphate synthase small subunit [Oligoflexia bacterium]|nr:glutamine-hydrolyzing carbamoyl-phosphate synthase small subunit [Oligoflexia bacterium]